MRSAGILLCCWVSVAWAQGISISQRRHTALPSASSWFEVRENVWVARRAGDGGAHTYVLPQLALRPGHTGVDLSPFNVRLQAACTEASPAELRDELAKSWSSLTGCAYRVVVEKGPFLSVEACGQGGAASPFSSCTQVRVDARRGAWSWLEGFRPQHRKAFLQACTKALDAARAPRKARWAVDPCADEEGDASGFSVCRATCDEKMLDSAELTDRGDLRFTVGLDLPQALQALRFPVDVPRAQFARWVDPDGPLAPP